MKNAENPVIAVIVPVYNTESYLGECLESIKAQTFKNFLCIIVNDGSTDNSSMIAHTTAEKDKRFKVYDKPNGGVSSARNLALDVLSLMENPVRYVCFIDSDDVVTPNFLSDFVTLMNLHKADYAECGIHSWFADGFREGKPPLPCGQECLDHNEIAHHMFAVGRFATPDVTSFRGLCNKCIKLDSSRQIRFDTALSCCEDQKYIFDIYPFLQKEVLIPQVNYFYRMRSSSATGTTEFKEERIRTDISVYEKTLSQPTEPSFKAGLASMFLNYLYHTWRNSVRDCPQSSIWLFDCLSENFKKYGKLCEPSQRCRLQRVRLGRKICCLYLRFRLKVSERRHYRKQRIRTMHEKFR